MKLQVVIITDKSDVHAIIDQIIQDNNYIWYNW